MNSDYFQRRFHGIDFFLVLYHLIGIGGNNSGKSDIQQAANVSLNLHELGATPFLFSVVGSDDKGVITPTLFEKVNELALKKGIPTAVDPKNRNFHCYKNVSLFKPNFKEFVQGVGIPIEKGNFGILKKAAEELKQKQNFKIIFVTLSELGVFISNENSEQYFPAEIRYIADVSGAGDTVVSLASLAMASGLPPKTIALMSNLAGGLVCEKNGVVPINKDQLIEEMLTHKI